MSSHIHIIASAKEDSDGISAIIRDFKKFTSKRLIDFVLNDNKESRRDWLKVVFEYHAKHYKRNTNYQTWKQNNHPKILLHPNFINQKINYIHNNPVVSQIVEKPEDYLYSSARNYLDFENPIVDVDCIDFGSIEGCVPL